jgi:radical SAM superfamily enzyme YgiQ (UPF0313 family)
LHGAKKTGKKIVAGGPLFTEEPESFSAIDHLVLNEAEITLPLFINDWMDGKPQRIYETTEYANLEQSPVPDYSLINIHDYATLMIQFTRGCPFDCEFCDITALLGRKVRVKSTQQIIDELDNLYQTGWRGSVFFVDDNFIGNKAILKNELLPAITNWMKTYDYPFVFQTELSINLADDNSLMELMVQAGFSKAFIGIETPDDISLTECNKLQNRKRDLVESVKQIQNAGIEVTAGFIVGFDNDTSTIFRRQIDFIQNSSIITAMVGLLNAPRKTKLYSRLLKEGRIENEWTGDNTDYSMNFIPKMNKEMLLEGYQSIVQNIYSGKAYYKRVKSFLKDYQPPQLFKARISLRQIIALIKSIFVLGIYRNNRYYYWKLFMWTLFARPKLFPMAIKFSIYGYHYQKVFRL